MALTASSKVGDVSSALRLKGASIAGSVVAFGVILAFARWVSAVGGLAPTVVAVVVCGVPVGVLLSRCARVDQSVDLARPEMVRESLLYV